MLTVAGEDAVGGTPFGRYRLVELLGRGGMGEVWRAFDTVTERTVAIKVLPTHLADDNLFQQRFRREARAAAGLDEPHVVPIFDFGEIDGCLYVAMRLIQGQDLQGRTWTVTDGRPMLKPRIELALLRRVRAIGVNAPLWWAPLPGMPSRCVSASDRQQGVDFHS
jgi:serine/threonine protein kinase